MAKYLNSDTTSHYLAPKNIPGVTIRINAVIQLRFGGFIAIVALFLGVYGNDDVTNRTYMARYHTNDFLTSENIPG